jgi:hypothetical protein
MSPQRSERERHPKRDLVVALVAVAAGAAVLLLGGFDRFGAVVAGGAVGAVVAGALQAVRSLRALAARRA